MAHSKLKSKGRMINKTTKYNMGNKEKDWRNMDERNMPLKEKLEYIARFDKKKYQNYQKYIRDVAGLDIKNKGLLQRHLSGRRFHFNMTITHLSMILGCSRTQYNRMERGENRFKEKQLETLAALYGEEPTYYKDMQDVDVIIKAASYFKDKDRSFRLMKMALCYMFPVFDDMGEPTDLTVFIPKDFIDVKPISKEDQRKMWMDIIERMQSRYRSNYNKMNEISNELTKMTGFQEKEQIPLREKFHLLEDEQISIDNLIRKLQNWLNSEESSS